MYFGGYCLILLLRRWHWARKKKPESVTVTGLEPDREYSFCIVAYSLSSGLAEPSYGAVVPFTTLALPPAVDHESASVTSTASTLEAQVNTENQETHVLL